MPYPARRLRPVALLGLGMLTLVAAGCRRTPSDGTPEGALRLWLEHMERAAHDTRAAREAYGLLGPVARANLEERARRTSLLTGRRVEPFEMLAPGRFGLRFRPKRMKARGPGAPCAIDVAGDDARAEQATVPCAEEASAEGPRYRLEPELPEPRTLPRRAGE